LITGKHRGQTTADAPFIQLHGWLWRKVCKHLLPFRIAEPSQVQFIVIAQEVDPLGSLGNIRHGVHLLIEESSAEFTLHHPDPPGRGVFSPGCAP
jgi:hypothetical protein